MNITKTIKRMAIAAAIGATVATGTAGIARADGTWLPATIVETSPVGRVEKAAPAKTYVYGGRTRVTLPKDVTAELETWASGYTERLAEWNAEDGEGFDAYYGGLEEGFSYAYTMVMSRLGYVDGDTTLDDVPRGWERTTDGQTFLKYDEASFGAID